MAINQGRPVLYVEPNWINGFDDGNGGMVPMIITPEDYCMYVDLKVEVYSRGMAATSGAKTMVVEWVSTSDEDAVRFMSGSRIYTDPSNEKFFNSLTTNYTNTYLGDIIEGKQTNELFGIDSINIKYNQFFVPEVTIQFTDIRGAGLFGVSQLAHLKRVNNISGFRDDDVADSFFSCFFTFPYPKFTLMFKGFYGRPLTYSLTCSSFNTKFDSESGCFKATATFIGYAYSFLGDISFSAILSSPYSDGGGKEYWKRRVEDINDDFFLYGENGERRKIPTMGEVLVALDHVEDKVKEATAGSEAIQKQTELDDKKNKIENIIDLNAQYMAVFTGESDYTVVEGLKGDLILLVKDAPDEGREWVLNEDIAKLAQERYDVLCNAAKEIGITPPLKEGFTFNTYLSIRVFNAKVNEPKKLSQTILKKVESWKRDTEEFKEKFMERCRAIPNVLGTTDNVSVRAGRTVTGETMIVASTTNDVLNYNHGFYIYNWHSSLKEMIDGKVSEVNQEISENNDKVAAAEAEALTKILGFAPTVYNMCKLIMSHVEVFVWLMYDTVKRIYDNRESRTPEALNFQNAEILSDFKVDTSVNFIPPFPQVTSQNTSDGFPSQENADMNGTEDSNVKTIEHADGSRTTIEEDWIGKISSNFEEQKLVEGLLNGAKEIGELMMKHAEAMAGGASSEEGNATSSSTMAGISGRECAVPNPVCILDMVLMNKDYGPWGKIDFNRYDDFAGKVFMRMEQCLKYSNVISKTDYASVAQGDVINFKSKFSAISGVVGKKILGDHNFDEFTRIITGKEEQYKKDGTYAWESSSRGTYGIAKKSGDMYQFNAFRTKDGEAIMPTEGRPFSNINGDLRPDNGTPPTFNIPASYSNYGFFNDVSVPDNGKSSNQNVFKIDVSGYADYSEYYKGATVKPKSFNTTFDFSSYLEWFDMDWIDDFFYDDVKFDTLSSIEETGRVKRMPSSVGISKGGSIFGEKGYYNKTSSFEKGYLFLKSCYKLLKSRQFDTNVFLEEVNAAVSITFLPRLMVLFAGAALYLANNGGDAGIKFIAKSISDKFRKEMIDGLVGHYVSWIANEFKQIDATYSIGRTMEFNSIDGDIDDDEIMRYINNPESFKLNYVADDIDYDKTTQSLELIFSESADTKPLVRAIFQPCALVFPCVNRHKGKVYNDTIPASAMKVYWDTFTEGLKEIATGSNASDGTGSTDGSTSTTNGEANTTTPGDVTTLTTPATSEAPEDVKVAMYHYCKIFFDKWIAGTDLDKLLSDWSLRSFFDPLDPREGRFHFIDSFYNEVGNRVLVNPQILYEDIAACQTQNGFNLMTVFTDLFSKNRFNFFCLENFKDLMDYDNFQDMFKPYPYNSMGKDDSISDFVAIYSYEPSSHLDIEDGTYPGDGFMLNNEELYPYAVKHKDLDRDYPIPAFGVTYGMQYQSYFNSIEVSMEKPMATEQSLKSQYLLAGAATDKTLVREYIPYGQDLFSIYSNNMYECTVKMMGCAYIQPLMYFCLTNVPLFRGAYLISKVEHSITPGNIETTFTGTRMAATATRIGTNWIHKGYAPEAFYQEHVFNAYGGGSGTGGSGTAGGGYGGGDYSVSADANEQERAMKVMNFTIQNFGYNNVQAAAIAGNIYVESNKKFDEHAYNPNDKGSPSHGLMQWKLDRANKNWQSFYKEKHPGVAVPRLDQSTFDDQLWYIKYEREHGEKNSYKTFETDSVNASVEVATDIFRAKVERGSGGKQERIERAKLYYSWLTNGLPQTTQSSASDQNLADKQTSYSNPWNPNTNGPALCGDSWSDVLYGCRPNPKRTSIGQPFKSVYPNGSIFALAGMTPTQIKKQVVDAAKRKRPFILVYAGINGSEGANLQKEEKDFQEMVDAAKGNNIPIYLCTIIDMGPKSPKKTTGLRNVVNPAIRNVCARNKGYAHLIDLGKTPGHIDNKYFHDAETYHLNQAGYNLLWKYIKSALPS